MIKFKDEAGNFVTPQKGDYVLASDIKDEAMHYEVSASFVDQGCKEYSQYGLWEDMNEDSALVWSSDFGHLKVDTPIIGKRRIIPAQQTLFEAACEAEDGTEFVIAGYGGKAVWWAGNKAVWWAGNLTWDERGERDVCVRVPQMTDFEQIPSGPKKRETEFLDICEGDRIKVPFDRWKDCADAFKLIGRLMQWEGARIGKPGYNYYTDGSGTYFEDHPSKYEVTFKTAEQCEAAWKAECPEMFE